MKILVVDDHEENRRFVGMLMTGRGHSAAVAADGEEGWRKLQSDIFDLVVSDILMPNMDGFRFIQRVRSDERLKDIPFVFFTGTYLDDKDEELAITLGADAFLRKPMDPEELARKLEEIASQEIHHRQVWRPAVDDVEPLRLYNESMVQKLEQKMADLEKEMKQRREAEEAANMTLEGAINALALMSELRDPYTAGHQAMVAEIAVAIAEEMNLSREQIKGLRIAGILHDVGKVYVPSEILNKPGRLNELEMGIVRTHAQASYDIVSTIFFPWPVHMVVRQHHERLDGSGYPLGLKGEEILLESRILAVADVLEAMVSHRPYRPALGLDAALAEITRGRGELFDAEAVDACLRLFREKGYRFSD